MNRLILRSHAKLNLYLEVLNKRKDSYHNIKTLFEKIDLFDTIILTRRQDKKINVVCSTPGIPCDNSNFTWQAARLLQERLDIKKGVDIKIIKRIPVAAGLGGGASNAAAVLVGLNKLWKLNLARDRLVGFAKKIGCDVPFFIYNTSFAQGQVRGDKITPLKSIDGVRLWHILIVPDIKVSTAVIYKRWDEYLKSRTRRVTLTRPKYDVKILTLALKNKDFALINQTLFNSLEQITIRLYPQVRRIKENLRHLGLKSILMSGSGPAVFSIVSSRKEAVSVCRQLETEHKSWQVFVARTAKSTARG